LKPTADSDTGHDKFRDECGVFGIYGHSEAPALTRLGLYALQHRGQESAGIATADGERLGQTVVTAPGNINVLKQIDADGFFELLTVRLESL